MKKLFLLTIGLVMMGACMAQDLHWITGNYLNNMTVVGVVVIDGVEQNSSTLEVGAFCGDECRGSWYASYFPPTQQYIATLTIGSDGTSGDVITFRLYDHSISKELDLECTASVTFLDNDRIGVPGNWFQFSFVTPAVTYNLPITGYGNSAGGYYLIAPPFDDIDPDEIEGMTSDDYDLYYFDQAQELEWINYQSGHFNLESGKGYLYAHKTDVNLSFTGTPYTGDGKVTLRKTGGLGFEGWNLVGNPYPTTATIDRDCYVMKGDGSEIIAGDSRIVAAMQGVFVIAAADNEEMSFTANGNTDEGSKITLNIVSNDRSGDVIDRTIIRFGEGAALPKFMLDESNTKIYIPVEGMDYAVVSRSSENNTPINFKANQNGTYRLLADVVNLDMDYLHLIDNKTGADIDLLVSPCYTFEANVADYASRFSLVYVVSTGVEEDEVATAQSDFAYVSNGEIHLVESQNFASLQIIDLTGRVIFSRDAARHISTSGMTPGIYVLRLVSGDEVRTQKIVVR